MAAEDSKKVRDVANILDDVEKLELLSLTSKLTTELERHTVGTQDKRMAEKVLGVYDKSRDVSDFKSNLRANEMDFSTSLVESLDRFIRLMHPKYNKQQSSDKSKDRSLSSRHRSSRTSEDKRRSDESKRSRHSSDHDREDRHRSRRSRADEDDTELSRRHESSSRKREFESSRRSLHYDEDEARSLRRRRERSPSSHRQEKVDDTPQLYKVYSGRVSNVKEFGAFVTLDGLRAKTDGLVHVSAIQEGARVNHPGDLLQRDQRVMVKVISIQGTRIGLSMKDVDQETGEDLTPSMRLGGAPDEFDFEGGRRSNEPTRMFAGPKSRRKRLTSPERWEIKQLIASGVVSAGDYPDLDEDVNAIQEEADIEPEEDVDIEVRDEEPPFLAGQTKQSLELSPIRVVKAPDGSMYRAAMTGTTLAKDRREQRQQTAREEASKEIQVASLEEQWEDPMVEAGARVLAEEVKSAVMKRAMPAIPEWKKKALHNGESFGKITNLSIKEQRQALPVYKLRAELIKAVTDNQLLIVVGDTGSGKTTQLTQYLAEAGFADRGVIACTQPRRVAASSVAKRVADEVGCKVGEEVGYTVRFEDWTSPRTKIKYMTDGMLQREALLDPDLKQYSVIMLDEAHERTIATDVLFALLKKTLKRRPDMRLIVTSATLDAEKFSAYFNNCPILMIPGRTFPVDIMFTKEPETDYLDAALITVMQIHLAEPPGDILVFLTGQEEIDTACEILYERMKALGPGVPELIILPVYSALPSEVQSRIFEPAPPGSRKVVIATNIAETSITIDGIYYVVDPGFVKISAFDPKLGMDSLVVLPISQAQARQRAGRAGRTGPGKCYRLYTEAAYESEMQPNTVPEIQRQNLSHTILMLKAMGINDLLHFDFMDPPPTNTMLSALEELYALSALDDEGLLTRLGRKMADFPMEPSLAKVLLASVDYGASDEILSIVAMLSVQTVFYRPKEKQQQADQKKAKFHDPTGDHLTLLTVYTAWKMNDYSASWCFENFIQARSMKRAQEVRQQLESIMKRYRHRVISCGPDTDRVRRALCSGFFRNTARKDPQEGFRTLIENTPVYMHPSSALFGKSAEYVLYHTLVLTSKEYMHCSTAIDPKWLVEAAPTFFKVADTTKLSQRKKNERIQPLFNRYAADPNEWRISQQRRSGRQAAADDAALRRMTWRIMGTSVARSRGIRAISHAAPPPAVARLSLRNSLRSSALLAMAPPAGYISTREDASARIAYLFSDCVVSVQPSLRRTPAYGFQHALDYAASHKTRGLVSRRGTLPHVTRVRFNADPFLTVLDELERHTFVSVVTPSVTLPASVPLLAKVVHKPVVLHVSLSRDFPDYGDIAALKSLGFTLLQSFSLREAQDIAIAAHLTAIRTGSAVIHFFALPENAEETPIPFEDATFLERVFDGRNLRRPEAIEGASKNIYWDDVDAPVETEAVKSPLADTFKVVDGVFETIRLASGRTYKAFEYSGAANADTALLIFGSSASSFISTIASAGWGEPYAKVGVLTVRVYRPWAPERLLLTLPRTVQKLGVLEQLHRQTTKWGPVLLDVISSLTADDPNHVAPIPTIVGYQLGYLDSKTIRQALRGIVQNVRSDTPIQNLYVGAQPARELESGFSLQQPELETAYSKILYNVFGEKLRILNALEKNDAGIAKTVASNPEYGFGAFLALEEEHDVFRQKVQAAVSSSAFANTKTKDLAARWLLLDGNTEQASRKAAIDAAEQLIEALGKDWSGAATRLINEKDSFTPASSWLIGSDAWAYDLGSSGVHHVLASGKNVNMLIIDSQPYSARAVADATRRKKDIGLYAMNYGNAYVASVAVYSSYSQALQAMIEADSFDGPSIVVAYLPYYEESDSAVTVLQETKRAVDSGYWPLYRWNPNLTGDDESTTTAGDLLPSFQLDSIALKKELKNFLSRENHLSQVARQIPVFAESLSGSYGSEVRDAQNNRAKAAYKKLLEGLTGPPLTILFASDGGNAENVAKRLQRRAKARGLGAVVLAMDDFVVEDLGKEENIVIITSTAGQGEFPQNGRNFWEAVKSSTDLDLATVNFSVFGLGDSHYWPRKQDKIYYNKPSKDLFHRMEILGAKQIIDLGLGDDQDPDGYSTGYNTWEAELWKALNVDGAAVPDEPAPITNEEIKINSNYLRGTIVQGLNDESTGAISAEDSQLTKFHGTYMQDDRDIREARKAAGREPAYSFMIRVRLPGSVSTPAQWIAMDDLADNNGNHTFKLTTRGTYQLHGVIKKKLKQTIKAINVALMDTIAACGDVNRNVMLGALPYNHALHKELHAVAQGISAHLLPQTTAYHEIWLTDDNDDKQLVAGNAVVDFEPLYGPTYLPRKFKIAIAIPPYNDVDVFANDVGLIAITGADGKLEGFNILAGGGMGTTHNNKKTYPRTGSIFGFVPTDKANVVCEKIMLVQRDNGDRKDRKHARLKYTIDTMGVDVFKAEVEELLGFKFEEARPFEFESNIDHFGWIQDERGMNHFTMFIENGRVEDTPEFQMKTGLREIAKAMKGEAEFRFTGNQHLILSNIAPEDMDEIKGLMAKYALDNLQFSSLRLSSSACVAFPTCGLAMAESERYLPIFVSKLEAYLEELGLRHDSIVLRMTGCPNGCARPWLAEVAMVGKAYGVYNLMLGGGYHGQRLNKLYRGSVNEQQALEILKPLFKRWSLEREEGEHFGDFLIRAGVIKPTLEGKTFHDDVPEEEE
ncbi:uncharacterized protein V1518DRAFT_383533 [Limtongia smithiae]|uniref:uncharacterized protein n=1 Tax=Limtongia smithiae TaxID=1125753 RepID=UPI0034CFDACB